MRVVAVSVHEVVVFEDTAITAEASVADELETLEIKLHTFRKRDTMLADPPTTSTLNPTSTLASAVEVSIKKTHGEAAVSILKWRMISLSVCYPCPISCQLSKTLPACQDHIDCLHSVFPTRKA